MSCCVDPLSLALAEISFSVADLTKKNYKLSTAEIQSLIEKHGSEAERHLFRCLFSVVDFSSDGKNSGKDFHQCQFLIQECQALLTKPNFSSILCYSIDNPEHTQKTLKPSPHLLPQISKVLKLSRVQEVVFGIGLISSSNDDIKAYAGQFVKQKLPDLLRTYIDADLSGNQEGGLNDVAIEVLHLLLSHLLYAPRDLVGIGDEQIQAFLDTLRRDFPKERVPVVLAPLLYHPSQQEIELDRLLPDNVTPPKLMMEEDLSELMQEIGYSCCANEVDCCCILGTGNWLQSFFKHIT